MNKMKVFAVTVGIILSAVLTGCGNTDSSSDAEEIKVKETVVGKTESSSVPDKEQELYGKNNIADTAEFNKVTIGDKEVDIYYAKVTDFTQNAGLEYNYFENIEEKNEKYSFQAKGYSRMKKDGENTVYGSVVYIEASWYYRPDEIIPDIQQSDWLPQDCTVKGICFDAEKQKDDFDLTFAGKIKLGDKRETIEKKLGKGTVLPNGETAYKNTKNTFIVKYNEDKICRVTIINNSRTIDTER